MNRLLRELFRVKCLEWSFALHTLLTKQSQKSYIKIGVQNNPFISHAWVEVEDKIIAMFKEFFLLNRDPLFANLFLFMMNQSKK